MKEEVEVSRLHISGIESVYIYDAIKAGLLYNTIQLRILYRLSPFPMI